MRTVFKNEIGSAVGAVAVSPSDETVIPPTHGIYVGGEGNLVVTMANGSGPTTFVVPSGIVLPIRVIKVMAATDATDIVALY